MKMTGKKFSAIALSLLLALVFASSVLADGVATPSEIGKETPGEVITPVTSNTDVSTNNTGSSSSSSSSAAKTVTSTYATTYVSADGTQKAKFWEKNNSGAALFDENNALAGYTNVEFAQASVTEGAAYDQAASVVTTLVPQCKLFKVFEFDITSNGTAIHQLNGYVNVTVVRPADLVIGEGQQLVVYRLEDNGTLTKCECAVDDNYVSFLTNHFSTYIFSVEDVTTATNNTTTSPKTGEF
jgi:hypothetical protein